MNKILSGALAALLTAATVLTAASCSGKTTSSGNTPSKMDATSTPSQAEELKPVTLTYWIMGKGEQKDSQKVWAQMNEELAKVLPNTQLNIVNVTGAEYKDKWLKACAAQDKIDLAWSGYTHSLPDDVSKGALMPLDDLIANYGADVQSYFGDDLLNIHRSADGKLYFIPAWQGLVSGRSMMFFPTELVNATVGDEWVKKIQQACYDSENSFTPEAKKPVYDLVEQYLEGNKKNGTLALGFNPNDAFQNYYYTGAQILGGTEYSFYFDKNDKTFTVKFLDASDVYKQNCAIMADWYKKGYIRSDIDSAEVQATDYKRDGLNGYIMRTHGGLEDNAAQIYSNLCGYEMTGIFTQKKCELSTGTVTGTVIPATASNPERAMMFIDLLLTEKGKDVYQTYVYGIKGEDYDIDSDGIVETLGDKDNPPYGNYKWTLGTCEFALPTNKAEIGQYTGLKKAENEAEYNPWVGFQFDRTEVETIFAGLKTVWDEYRKSLQYGSLGDGWEARYNEYLQRLDEAGINDYIKEVQKQVDAYAAKNNLK